VGKFTDKLNQAATRADSLLCVGLDPDHRKLPPKLGQFSFNRAIIDATADLVCAFKPNPAFYEALGAPGVQALKDTCDYIQHEYPHIPIIVDAKRGDIGNTNDGYIEYVFDYLGADAVTLPPYMGGESFRNFLERRDKGIIILCRTSNPGAGEFQDLRINNEPLYLHVARQAAEAWNTHDNIALVVGSTYPRELRQIRDLVGPSMPILVPGTGAQGGDLAASLQAGLNQHGLGLVINASRSVIFAHADSHFAAAARIAASKLRDEINAFRQGTRD
jgi:orotidine-5'-phosphate decarboxylase